MKRILFYCKFNTFCFILCLLLYHFSAKSQTALNIEQCLTNEEVIALVDSVLLLNVDSVFKKNISFTGDPASVGYYTNGYVLGFEKSSGIVMSTGFAAALDNSNTCVGATSGITDGGSDADLQLASGRAIQDAVIIEFDVMLSEDTIHLDYIFGSEEYHEWVGTLWNDVFGFFVSGQGIDGPYSNNAINIAKIPGTNDSLSMSNVNCGNVSAGCDPPPGFGPNCELLQNNTEPSDPGFNQCALDAYTFPVETFQHVNKYTWYHFKLAIGDALDAIHDSGIFLAGGTLVNDSLMTTTNNPPAKDLFSIKPNPASDYLEILNFGNEKVHKFLVVDINGQALKKGVLLEGNHVSLDGLPSGLLIIELLTAKDKYRYKFLHFQK